MGEEECQRAETLAAVLTLVGSLPCVQTNVCQEPGLLREGLVTVGAFERFLARVEPTVSLQM